MILIFLILFIIFYIISYFINIEMFSNYNNLDNPIGYEHRWYNWDGPWGYPWMLCNPLKKYKKPVMNWYWY